MSFTAKAWKIVALRESPVAAEVNPCKEAWQVARYWREHIATEPEFSGERENLYAIHLNARLRPTGHHCVSVGVLDSVYCEPREAYRAAIIANAHGLVLAHNHPSGDTTPSRADIRSTKLMIQCGRLLHIELLDHVIVGPRWPYFTSLRELGVFFEPAKRKRRKS